MLQAVEQARKSNPKALIVARAQSDEEEEHLRTLGANVVILDGAVIGDHSFIGLNATIAPFVTVGQRNLIGAGTRTVFRDGGSGGVVLRLGSAFAGVTEVEQGWWIGAAAPLALIGARFVGGAPKTTLSTLRFAAGSVGASLATDEGWEPWVESVKWIQRSQEHTCPLHEVPGKGSVVFTEVLIRRTPREKARPPVVPHGWFKAEDDVCGGGHFVNDLSCPLAAEQTHFDRRQWRYIYWHC